MRNINDREKQILELIDILNHRTIYIEEFLEEEFGCDFEDYKKHEYEDFLEEKYGFEFKD